MNGTSDGTHIDPRRTPATAITAPVTPIPVHLTETTMKTPKNQRDHHLDTLARHTAHLILFAAVCRLLTGGVNRETTNPLLNG